MYGETKPHVQRQQAAAVFGVGLALLPIAGMLISLFVWGWLATAKNLGLVHVHEARAPINWFDQRYTDSHGKVVDGPRGLFFGGWYMGLLTLYLLYQVCELIAWGVRSFAGLHKRQPRRKFLDDEVPVYRGGQGR